MVIRGKSVIQKSKDRGADGLITSKKQKTNLFCVSSGTNWRPSPPQREWGRKWRFVQWRGQPYLE